MIDFPRAFFVTGTDTDIGKTVVSAVLMAGLRGTYWKPVQSGLAEPTDTQWVQRASGLAGEHFLPETHRLSRPLSPHASAHLDGCRIDLQDFRLPDYRQAPLLVEGAGGLMVPLNETHLVIDLIEHLGLPVLVVARNRLGTINHTLLTLNALKARALPVLGVVLNGEPNEINRQAIETYGGTPVICELPTLPNLDQPALAMAFDQYFRSNNNGLSDLASVHANANSGHAAARKSR